MTPLLAALAAQTESSLCLCLKTKGKVGSDAVALQQHGHRSPGSSVGARGHAGEEGCGAPDHTLTPAPVLKPALPAWISWAVAGRKCGYLWRGWLLATGEWWLGMCQHDFSCGGSSAGPTSRDTSSSSASNQHHLPQQPLLPLPPCQQQQNLLLP